MNEWNPFLRDRYVFHGQGAEVRNAAAQGALKHEGIADFGERLRELRRADDLELLGPQENGIVVQDFDNSAPPFAAQATVGGLGNLVVVLKQGEEGADELHVLGHGVEAEADGGRMATVELLI